MAKLVIGKRYTVERRLGSGMFGQVFLCHNKFNGKLVAVKVTDDDTTLKREAQFYRLLRGVTNIPRLLSFGAEGKYTYMVLPYCGKELGDWCPASLSARIQVANTLLDALGDVHRHSIVHSDIKPANILVDGVTPMIVDFGMSRLGSKPAGRPTKVIGSKTYASLRALDLQYPEAMDDMESLGLAVLFPRARWCNLGEREAAVTELTSGSEHSFFAVLRDNVHIVNPSTLKEKLDVLITKQELGLKV